MASANLNITVTEKRMLNQSEAAGYNGLPAKHFKAIFPVRPVRLPPNVNHGDELFRSCGKRKRSWGKHAAS